MAKKPEIILLSDSSEAVSASSDHVNAGAIENGNEGSSKPPSGSKEMYRPWVAPKIAEMFRTRSVPKSVIEWYGYASVADYHADADYWDNWQPEDEDELEDSQWSLEFYEDYVPKKKVKSPGPIAVLGLQNKVTWMDMVKKMGIRGAGITGKGKGKVDGKIIADVIDRQSSGCWTTKSVIKPTGNPEDISRETTRLAANQAKLA
ncbi:hypothetical protein Tco_1368955 [Tanacetum coccineum]